MNIKYEKVFERDIDLLIINKFINDNKLKDYFLKRINLFGYNVVSVYHSLSDKNGESDITVILEKDNEKIGLLIEDKIDAPAMKKQKERYEKRGNKGINEKLYDKYYIFIIAPKDYLETNQEAKLYDNKISYEEFREVLKEDIYATSLIDKALDEKKSGYVIKEDKQVTLFWKNYYDYIKKNYPKLKIHEVEGPRGSDASWPEIYTAFRNVKIIHKSDRGYMDLTYYGEANNHELIKELSEVLESDMFIRITGKSLAIRLEIPIIDFKKDFNDYLNEMKASLDAASRLYDFSIKVSR